MLCKHLKQQFWGIMDVHHSLKDIYNKIRRESVDYLKNTYGAIEIESENVHKYPVTVKIGTLVENLNVNLLVNIPFNFPDSFPNIKLDDRSFQQLYPLPHLNKFSTLCLFDEVVASPNPDNPLGILDASIKKAKELLKSGILEENINDYTDEFETYWAEDSKDFYLSIVTSAQEPKMVYLVPFKYGNWHEKGIFSDNKNEAIMWIQNLGGSFNEEEITQVLYIPLNQQLKFPFPKDNKDIYHLLREGKSGSLKEYFQYLSKFKRPTKVLFSVQSDNNYSWGAWEHLQPFKKIVSKYKGRKKVQKGIKGFRVNSQNGWLEIVKEFPKREIIKYSVEDVSAFRLKTRGGDGKLDNIGLKIAIVGCGAVGSHLAQGLFDIGIQHLLLVDSDRLSFENVNRHLCGVNQVGQFKTEAIKNRLRRHYPTSQIHVYNDNVLSLIQANPNTLNPYDLIILAISNSPAEIRINELQMNNVINSPILNVWVEPYLAGGHGVWIEPGNSVPIKMLFDNGSYKYQILKNGNLYSKKELGCNTSYVPYGALELKKFIIDVIMFIQQQLNKEIRRSKVLTWLGNLTEQKNNKRILAPKWVGANDYSTRFYDIEISHESVDLSDI